MSRSTEASIVIVDARPDDVFPLLLARRDQPDFYEGGDLHEVRDFEALPGGRARWVVIDHLPWGRLERSVERLDSLAPHDLTVRVTDSFGQVIRYDYRLTAHGGDTHVSLTAELEHESSAPRGRLAGQWRTDGRTRQGIAQKLGHIRQEFERKRARPAP